MDPAFPKGHAFGGAGDDTSVDFSRSLDAFGIRGGKMSSPPCQGYLSVSGLVSATRHRATECRRKINIRFANAFLLPKIPYLKNSFEKRNGTPNGPSFQNVHSPELKKQTPIRCSIIPYTQISLLGCSINLYPCFPRESWSTAITSLFVSISRTSEDIFSDIRYGPSMALQASPRD